MGEGQKNYRQKEGKSILASKNIYFFVLKVRNFFPVQGTSLFYKTSLTLSQLCLLQAYVYRQGIGLKNCRHLPRNPSTGHFKGAVA